MVVSNIIRTFASELRNKVLTIKSIIIMEMFINAAAANANKSANLIIDEPKQIITTTASVMPTEAKPVAWSMFGEDYRNQPNITIQEVISDAKLDYNVSKQHLIRVSDELYDAVMNGEPTIGLHLSKNDLITSHCATVDDTNNQTLGVVGRDYGIVQNSKAFEFINFIQEVSGVTPQIETAGRLGRGERMFVTARLGEDAYLSPNDNIKNYVVFTNSHDGSGAVMCFFTPIRVICANTLNMAIHGAQNKVVFKHTKHVNSRLDWEVEENRKKALEVFSRSVKFSETFIERMKGLQAEKVDTKYVNDFTAQLLMQPAQYKLYLQADRNLEAVEELSSRTKNAVYALRNSIENGVGQNFDRGTKLWLMNGVTTLLHNEAKWKNAEAEFNALMEGSGQKKVQKAYDLLTKVA